MNRLRNVRTIFGAVTPAVHRLMATAIDDMINEAMNAAVSSWRDDAWIRFGDHEADCTVQLHARVEEAVRKTPRLRSLSPRLEWVQVTPGMLAGTESAATAGRPDLRFYVGLRVGVAAECKRLSLGAGHPRLYVNEGMARFVTGEYASKETRGGMIGYVQADQPDEIVGVINRNVIAHAAMGPGHELRRAAAQQAITDRYRSEHQRVKMSTIDLEHYLVDMR
jgi:hypothetical protein